MRAISATLWMFLMLGIWRWLLPPHVVEQRQPARPDESPLATPDGAQREVRRAVAEVQATRCAPLFRRWTDSLADALGFWRLEDGIPLFDELRLYGVLCGDAIVCEFPRSRCPSTVTYFLGLSSGSAAGRYSGRSSGMKSRTCSATRTASWRSLPVCVARCREHALHHAGDGARLSGTGSARTRWLETAALVFHLETFVNEKSQRPRYMSMKTILGIKERAVDVATAFAEWIEQSRQEESGLDFDEGDPAKPPIRPARSDWIPRPSSPDRRPE